MLQSLTIEGFRSFRSLELTGLGRINLLVGSNNSGKTSVLEAIELVARVGDPHALVETLERRFEYGSEPDRVEISHLFFGHVRRPGSRFQIKAANGESAEILDAEIVEPQSRLAELAEGPPRHAVANGAQGGLGSARWPRLTLHWHGTSESSHQLWLLGRGELPTDQGEWAKPQEDDERPVHFISAEALDQKEVTELLDEILLRPEEAVVLDALHIIDPTVDAIAIVAADRGGVIVRRSDSADRLPIGNLGAGIWRLLGIAASLVRTRGGVLLIDEIDAGLHFTVMEQMWKLVYETAKRLDVQVFATTHSHDCTDALASICRPDVSEGSEVTMHRIEPGKTEAIAYSAGMIVAAATRGIEVR